MPICWSPLVKIQRDPTSTFQPRCDGLQRGGAFCHCSRVCALTRRRRRGATLQLLCPSNFLPPSSNPPHSVTYFVNCHRPSSDCCARSICLKHIAIKQRLRRPCSISLTVIPSMSSLPHAARKGRREGGRAVAVRKLLSCGYECCRRCHTRTSPPPPGRVPRRRRGGGKV